MSVNPQPPRISTSQPKPLKLTLESSTLSGVAHSSRSTLQACNSATPHRIFGGSASFLCQSLDYQKFDSHSTTCTAKSETRKPCEAPDGLLKKRSPENPSQRVSAPAWTAASHSTALDQQQTRTAQLSSAEEDSEESSLALQASAEAQALGKLATLLVEENRLVLGDPSAPLGEFEKLFICNLLFIINRSRLSPDRDTDAFINEVNAALRRTREKRKDAQLRFVYKRAIKILMSKITGYIANKSHHMQDYAQDFLRYYFPDLSREEDHTAAGSKQNVMDTSFASKKKYLRLFVLSPKFKKDLLDDALPQLQKKYSQYTLSTFCKMARHLRAVTDQLAAKAQASLAKTGKPASRPVASVEKRVESHAILYKRFKRVPWSAKELERSIALVRSFAR